MNLELNRAEFDDGAAVLKSTPRRVTLGTHNACNAKCLFCLEGKYDRFDLDLYKRFFEAKMGHFIQGAESITFTGFGEVLWVPGIEEFLDHINQTLPNTEKIFTTNGTPLRPSVVDRLLKGRYVIQVSLHASSPALHEELTLLPGKFEGILENIKNIVREREKRGLRVFPRIQLIDVLNTKNLSDVVNFIELASELRADDVRCEYMTMFVPEHIDLSCFFIQEETNRWLEKALERARLLKACAKIKRPDDGFRVFLPSRFGSGPAQDKPARCSEPWEHVYVELQGPVLPCCFWGGHAGNLNKGDQIDSLWNGAFYRRLREGMANNAPHPWCAGCVRYRGYNVDNILCHITNRPAAQKAVLQEVVRRGLYAGQPDLQTLMEQIDGLEKAEKKLIKA